MKRWRDCYPDFMRRLWFQLAISYTVLAFCAMVLLVVMLYGINDYSDFRATLTLDNVERQVMGERLTLVQALRDAGKGGWLDKARDNIRAKLTNMEHGSGTSIYRITNSSRPEVYMQISDSQGRLLLSDPGPFPAPIAARFAAQAQSPAPASPVTWLAEGGPIWVDMPVMDGFAEVGRLRIVYVAEFDFLVQLQSVLDFLFYTWGKVLLLSVPIGIACGLVASRYVTRQLQKMNAVTESWRQGDFGARIALPDDDVLIRHSQHLNEMAQDLAMYLELQQRLAVTDERNRMARELHDTVKQKLFALGLQLAAAKSKPAVMVAAREPMLEAEALTREAQHDLMEIITQLRPTGSRHDALYGRISMLADDFRRRFAVSITLQLLEPIPCDAHAEHHVLRIVQEAVMNAVRHGKASEIAIVSQAVRDMATLTIADNGSGFNTGKKTGGFGIVSMRGQALALPCGAFDVQSAPGTGTQITLSWKNTS